MEVDNLFVFICDADNLLPAKGTIRMVSPPFFYAFHAVDMSTGQFSEVIQVISQADDTFPNCGLSYAFHFGHSTGDA